MASSARASAGRFDRGSVGSRRMWRQPAEHRPHEVRRWVSNTLTGNGWREEMICSIKAQAKASGNVSKVIVANRNGGPTEPITGIRQLISAGANGVLIKPSHPDAPQLVLEHTTDKGTARVA